MAFILLGLRVVPGLVLVLFGLAKAFEHQAAGVAAVRGYRLLGPRSSAIVSAALPGAEIALGVLLSLGIETRAAGVLSAALFVGFSAAMASALLRGVANECGCGGALRTGEVRWPLVARNGLLAASAASAALLGPGDLSLSALTADSPVEGAVVLVAALGATVLAFARLLQAKTPPAATTGR
ncbi:MauE/DoxX family redox-associated membrane protein [Sinomonas sp. JGH33]|uniref:MauE/DoxX family redox-associated membrane protein n=1 Tax=Sinomonas terricola TaxID=3110330 RepID=A0ABU5T337_9MICC|nr:MauE/DoxX family redox-associated membrane protein [Sinomonas sp. JGH33]MEA5453881.1 MauE/DoxX family redox-associated membrane protein [Sinomonas sp. JGH33]